MDATQLAGELHQRGWSLQSNFISAEETAGLAEHIRRLNAQGLLQPARIGHHSTQQRNGTIRGDTIAWADEETNPIVTSVQAKLEALRETLNRELTLGLFEFEGHFACYPAGTFYRKHLDQFRDSDARRLSCVLYLNPPDWTAEDGGELRLYLDGQNDSPYLDFKPIGGNLLVFLSDRFYHEVLPTQRERLSFTGWFRVRV